MYYYFKNLGLTPINPGAFENNFNRVYVKYLLSSNKIPSPNFQLIGSRKVEEINSLRHPYIIKDFFGKPHKKINYTYDSSLNCKYKSEVIYLEKCSSNLVAELKVYVAGKKIFYFDIKRNPPNKYNITDSEMVKDIIRVGEIFNLEFYSLDIGILKSGGYLIFDVNQNPSYRWIKNQDIIISTEIRRIIDG